MLKTVRKDHERVWQSWRKDDANIRNERLQLAFNRIRRLSMLTSQELMDRFDIEKNYTLSKRLKPLKDALGVTQLHEKIEVDSTTQWIFKSG